MKEKAIILKMEDPSKKRATFAALLSREVLSRGGSPPVVVGGEAVELYTQGSYTTGDIDILSPKGITEAVLKEWNFQKRGRTWFNAELDIYVDWQGGALKNAKEPETVVIGKGFEVKVLSFEDLVLDRLKAAKWWGDTDSLMWARVLLEIKQAIGRVDLDYLKEKAKEEDIKDVLAKTLSSIVKERGK